MSPFKEVWRASVISLLLLTLFKINGGITFTIAGTESLQSDEDFAFDFTGDDDLMVEVTSSDETISAIRKLWGVPDDITAYVGKIFKFDFPSDAFTKGVKYYELKAKDGKALPEWLLFNKTDASLRGVPLYPDTQESKLILYAYRNSEDFATDELKLTVKTYSDDSLPKLLNCTKRNFTILSILFNESIKNIKPKQRLILLENLAHFWGIDSSALKIAGQFRNERFVDSKSIILVGPGDKKATTKQQSAVQLIIGCNGIIDDQYSDLLRKLKEQGRDGTISEVTGLPMIGWKVAKESYLQRKRRDAEVPEGGRSFAYYDEDAADDDIDGDEDSEEGTTDVPPLAPMIPLAATTKATPDLEKSTHPHRHHHQIRPEDEIPKFTPIIETFDIVTTPVTPEIKTTTVQNIPEVTTTRPFRNTEAGEGITEDDDDTEDDDNVFTKNLPPVDTTRVSNREPPPLEEDDDDEDGYDDDEDDEYDAYEDHNNPVTIEPNVLGKTTPTTPATVRTSAEPNVIITEPTIIENSTVIPISPTQIPPKETEEEMIASTLSTLPLFATSLVTTPSSPLPYIPTDETPEDTPVIDLATIMPTSPTTPSTTTAATTPLATTLPTLSTDTTYEEDTTVPITTMVPTTEEETTPVLTRTVTISSVEFARPVEPVIRHRLQRLQWKAGVIHRFIIPNDTFSHPTGEKLTIKLLDVHGSPVKRTSWVQLNETSNEVYGLPLEKDVSKWNYIIQASDSNGGNVSDDFEINVQHHKAKRTLTHEFIMKLRIEDKYNLPRPLDWQIRVLQGIRDLYKNDNLDHILTRNVEILSDPVTFTWSNLSLPTDYCPIHDIKKLLAVLVSDNEGTPSRALQNALAPEIRVKHVRLKGLEQCDGLLAVKTNVSKNTIPMPRNQIDHINATIGELLVYKVPADTFFDNEDGNTRKLKLSLLSMDRQVIPSNHWLQFDEKNQEFYGIPHVYDSGRHEYQLVCEDSGGLTANDGLVVTVHQQPARIKHPSVHFSMTIDKPYDTFVKNARLQRKFVEKISELFNDRDTSQIVIESITDSTVVTWVNRSLHTIVCPNQDIARLRRVLMNDDDGITDRVTNVMNSDFNVEAVSLLPAGVCLGESTVHHPEISVLVPDDSRASTPSESDDYLVTFIIPGIIVITMLLLAGIVACMLVRRRRRSGKLNVGDDEQRALRSKGIPVIFQDELEDKPEPGNKTPIIMKEEKPPLPPPEYSKRGDSPEEEALYQPPPPFPANRDSGRSLRPKATPTYRKPPPYVPP